MEHALSDYKHNNPFDFLACFFPIQPKSYKNSTLRGLVIKGLSYSLVFQFLDLLPWCSNIMTDKSLNLFDECAA